MRSSSVEAGVFDVTAPGVRTAAPGRTPSWILTATVVGMPLWWALGVAPFIWIIAAAPMAWVLLHRTPLKSPPGFGLFLLFLGWVLVSASQAEGLRIISIGYRVALYMAAAVLLLFIYNMTEAELPRSRILKLATVYFAYGVVGGYAAMVLGDLRFTSPMEYLLPGAVIENPFAQQLVRPTFAQTQDFLGVDLPRPTAPFVFTNEWGSGLGFLFPMVIAAWGSLERRWHNGITLLALVAFIPIIVSVNRGLWVAIIVSAAYGTMLLAGRGDRRYAKALLTAVAVVAVLTLATPLGGLISSRLESDHSNNSRLTIYGQTIEQVQDSPWIGYGAPRVNEDEPNKPAVGTHGQFWTVLFSHGLPGAALFVAFALVLGAKTLREQDRAGIWLHVSVALVPILMWFYEMLNQPIFIIMLAAGTALRGVPKPAGVGDIDPVLAAGSTNSSNRPTETRPLARTL